MVFANITNVLDAKSGWISSLTLFLLLSPSSPPSPHPSRHFVIWYIYLEDVGMIQFKNYLLTYLL